MAYLFIPPGRVEHHGTHPLFGRLTLNRGMSLVKTGGYYRQVSNPSDEDVAAAEVFYLGGHVYTVSDTAAADLRAAGYGEWLSPVVGPNPPDPGGGTETSGLYGEDEYGAGAYGGVE